MILIRFQLENATEAEHFCNRRGTFAQREVNFERQKRNESGTFLQRKVNNIQAVATKAEHFRSEMQRKRYFHGFCNGK